MSSVEKDPLSDSNVTDAELLGLIVEQHDRTAMQTLIEKHSALMMSVCYQILQNQNDAEDAFQATIVNFVKDADKIKEGNYVSTWLYRVAQRESINILRQHKREPVQAIEEQSVVAAEHDMYQEKFDELTSLHEELDQLPDKYRGPLCYLEGKSRQEAARELAVSVNSIKASLATGRKQLQKRLLKRGVAFASVLTVWNATQSQAGVSVSTVLVQQAIQTGVAHSTGTVTTASAGTTSFTTSINGSQGALAKGTMWMAISTGKKMGIGIVAAVLLLLSGTVAVISTRDRAGIQTPVQNETAKITNEPLIQEMKELITVIKENEKLYENLELKEIIELERFGVQVNPVNAGPVILNQPVQIDPIPSLKGLANISETNYLGRFLRSRSQERLNVYQNGMYLIQEEGESVYSVIEIDKAGDENQWSQWYESRAINRSVIFDGHNLYWANEREYSIRPETKSIPLSMNPFHLLAPVFVTERSVKFSDLLKGGTAASGITEHGELPNPEHESEYQSTILKTIEVDGNPIIIVKTQKTYQLENEPPATETHHLYLSPRKNYIPVKWERKSNQTASKSVLEVTEWTEPEKGVWFPRKIEGTSEEQGYSTQYSITYEVLSLSPKYPIEFFQIEEPKKIDEQQ